MVQVGVVRFRVVCHTDQRRREAGNLWFFGNHQCDRLTAEPDPVVVQWPVGRTFRSDIVPVRSAGACHGWPVLMREHADHTFEGKRLARVNARDATPGNGGCHDAGVRKAGRIELAGIFRLAGDLGVAVNAGCSGADV